MWLLVDCARKYPFGVDLNNQCEYPHHVCSGPVVFLELWECIQDFSVTVVDKAHKVRILLMAFRTVDFGRDKCALLFFGVIGNQCISFSRNS